MAKKRKKKNSDVGPEHELPGGFWHQVLAVIMLALAVILVMTWFDHGGSLLNHTHAAFQWLIGYAAYFIPLLLVYLAVKIFRSDTNRLPIVVWIASVLMVLWLAGIFGIPTIGQTNPTGGIVGEWLNLALTQILDSGVVVFIYIVLIFITAIFILQVSPAAVFKAVIDLFHSKKEEDADNAKVARAVEAGEKLELKVNPGVTIAESSAPKVKSFDAKKPTAPAPERALVSTADPDWKMPSVDLLEKTQTPADAGNIQKNALIIKNTFAEFGIDVEMEGANVGPRVTQYTLRAPGGINLAKIAARDKELAYKLSAQTVRIEAPIPGTQLIGVEVPNTKAAIVSLRGIIESEEWSKSSAQLTFAVGKNISGKPIIADLANMPHLLIAGTTGSGKSVMTNSLIMSLLYRNSPSDMRLIIVDPKRVEMVNYNDIPHLLTPVISDTTKALSAIKWATGEMDRRYKLMAEEKVKKISDYNAKMERLATKDAKSDENESTGDSNSKSKMPYIVIIIDEMSDLMMQASKELEPLIVRIAQLGRAAGMHLVLATQKPVVKVITGLIKGNIPSRIAFRVLTSMESRIILDVSGAEKLLGDGDMLFSTEKTMNGPERIQGAWTPDEDIEKVTNFLREQRAPDYNDEVISQTVAVKGLGGVDGDMGEFGRKFDPNDPFVRQAVQLSINAGRFATSHLQANMRKGHGWVAGLAIWLEQIGVIGPINGTKPREVLITSMEEFDELANGQ